MRERAMMCGVWGAALLGAGIALSAYGQEGSSLPGEATAEPWSLWPHIHTAADLGDIRGGSATWDASDGGSLTFEVDKNDLYAWVTIPAAPMGWDLSRRTRVEASVSNLGPTPAEV